MDREAVRAQVDLAFAGVPRPNQFMPDLFDPEARDHEELLQGRSNGSLTIQDVGAAGYTPISSCSAEGIRYFMPALARMALESPTYNYNWFADTLLLYVLRPERAARLRDLCSPEQRRAVSDLLRHYLTSQHELSSKLSTDGEIIEAIEYWGKA